jgi:hypothetical protein
MRYWHQLFLALEHEAIMIDWPSRIFKQQYVIMCYIWPKHCDEENAFCN